MLSQYLGKKDETRVRRIFTMACAVSEGVCALFALAAVFASRGVMRLLTNDPVLMEAGSEYLRIAGVSYLFMGISQIDLVLLKARKESHRSMAIGVMTLALNLALNAVFIFGLLGVPAMGIRGVAIATCIARAVELLACLTDAARRRIIAPTKRLERVLFQNFVRICAPLTAQGFVWGGAMAMISAIMGRLGEDMVAAHAVAASVQSIATAASFGLAGSAVAFGVLGCAVMLAAEGAVTLLFHLTGDAPGYLRVAYRMLSVNTIFASITYTMLCGVFPAGGDTRYGLVLDGTVMWSLVALGAMAAFVLRLHPLLVFVVLNVDELTKTPLVLLRYRKGTWLRNITRSREA